jgi:hypothetical protein
MKMKVAAIILAVVILGAGLIVYKRFQPPRPFGFRAGMTQTEIADAIGSDGNEFGGDGVAVLRTAPIPNKEFSEYRLKVSPKYGLILVETFKTVEPTAGPGEFHNLNAQLMAKYGKPTASRGEHNVYWKLFGGTHVALYLSEDKTFLALSYLFPNGIVKERTTEANPSL